MIPFQKRMAEAATQYNMLHIKSIYVSGIVRKANTICQISEGTKEQTNIVSNKVPWLHNFRRSLLVPVGFIPTKRFKKIKTGIMIRSIKGKALTSI
jgi:hypothetical protein